MIRRSAAVILLVGLTAACGANQDPSLDTGSTTPSADSQAAASDAVTLSVALSPEAVTPGPGTDGGQGSAEITLHRTRGEVCIALRAEQIAPITGAHIHQGGEGTAGDVVLSLQVPSGNTSTTGGESSCAAAAPNVLARIRLNPSRFYLDIHTDERPNGALRGQLS